MKRKLGFIAFMIVFVSLAILMAVFGQGEAKNEPNPTTVLSDGRKIELFAVTFGTNHAVTVHGGTDNLWTSLAPRGLLKAFGVRDQTIRSSWHHETLIPWLIIPRAPGSRSNPKLGMMKVVSEAGVALSVGGRNTRHLGDGRSLVHTRVSAFPRRDPYFSLTGLVDRLPFSIRIRNPIFGRRFPIWTPRSLPATNHHGDYQFVLSPPKLHPHAHGGYLGARLKIFHQDRPVENWFNTVLDVSDPTGNRSFTLSTNEPLWKAHFQMWKTIHGPWDTNDYREFKLGDLPADAGHKLVALNDTVSGFRFGKIWIGGPGSYEFESGVLTKADKLAPGAGERWSNSSSGSKWTLKWARHDPWVIVEVDHWPRGNQRISIFMQDSKRKDVRVEPSGWTGHGGVKLGMFLLKPSYADINAARKESSKSTRLKDLTKPPFTLRVGVQTNLQTEFVVDITKLKRTK